MKERLHRFDLFLLFLVCGLLVFLVFSHFRPLLPADIDIPARIGLIIAFLTTALLIRRSERLKKYWLVFFAFFAAAFALSLDLYLSHWSLRLLSLDINTPAGYAVDKLESTFLIVISIIVLTKVSGSDMASIYLKKGNLKLGLVIGIVVFLVIAAVSIPWAEWQFQGRDLSLERVIPWTPWILLFVLTNAINEELLFRGLFLRKLEPFLGAFPSNLLIAIVFTIMHVGVDYTPDVLMFLAFLLPLGLAMGYVMQKTDSILGSVLIHAAVDIPVVIGLYSTLS
jgi:membrane protease YdiL (CAAX protease family)